MRDSERDRSSAGFWAALFAGIGNAITDIRQKVVEEGWFGHAVTPLMDETPAYRPILPATSASFEEAWRPRDRDAMIERTHEHDRGIDGPGIDR